MSEPAPPGIARFDSAAGMARALGHFLHGREFTSLTSSAALAAMARAVSSPDLYLPVPTIRRERKERPAMTRESILVF